MSAFDRPWWLAGGVGLEVFCGQRIRSHGDIDIEVLRQDVDALAHHLDLWELWSAHQGRLTRWRPGQRLHGHSLWACPQEGKSWQFEIMLAASVPESVPSKPIWAYRRAPSITRELGTVGLLKDGLPVLAPEVSLLFKAPTPRPRDDQDLSHCLPKLSKTQFSWLKAAIALAHPASPWRSQL